MKKICETETEVGYISTGFIRDLKYDNQSGEYHVFVQLDYDVYDAATGEYIDYNSLVDDPDDYIDLIIRNNDTTNTTGLFDSYGKIKKRRVLNKYVEFQTLFVVDGFNVERTLINLDVYPSREKYRDGNDISE